MTYLLITYIVNESFSDILSRSIWLTFKKFNCKIRLNKMSQNNAEKEPKYTIKYQSFLCNVMENIK